MMTTKIGGALIAGLALAAGGSVPSPAGVPQEPAAAKGQAKGAETLESINADFAREVRQLEARRLARIARLAEGQPADQARATYVSYFQAALTSGMYREAEPIAERILGTKETSPELLYLASVTNILSEVDRGDFDGSLRSLAEATAAGKGREGDPPAAALLPKSVRFSLMEAYYQKLLQADQLATALKAFRLIREGADDPVIRDFASDRLSRLEMVGRPAPPIEGKDLDDHPINLADMKGDVVLVTFWASWCLPSAAEASQLNELYSAHKAQGLRILGVNVDALQEGEGQDDPASVLGDVRRFLVDHNVRWPILINRAGELDYAKAYGIEEIPANFLIGRDGNVVRVDLSGPKLAEAVRRALGR